MVGFQTIAPLPEGVKHVGGELLHVGLGPQVTQLVVDDGGHIGAVLSDGGLQPLGLPRPQGGKQFLIGCHVCLLWSDLRILAYIDGDFVPAVAAHSRFFGLQGKRFASQAFR